jgi:LPS sulfotransferase NodH
LCDLLSGSGIAGRPDSFFRYETFPWWTDYLDVSTADWDAREKFDSAYLSAVKEWGSNGTPVFGMRLMWESVNDLSKRLEWIYPDLPQDSTRFEAAFGNSLYLHLSRRDKIAQAISRYRAEQSGLWHKYSDGSERERLKPGQEPAYDAHALSKIVASLEERDSLWASWFRQQGIDPIPVNYEKLASNPQVVLSSVLYALGLDCTIAESIKPTSAQMADSKSQAWADRFRRERGEP